MIPITSIKRKIDFILFDGKVLYRESGIESYSRKT